MGATARIDEPLAGHGHALADALEQQAATAEILRAISRSPGDAQPVFDTIAAAALKLCRARSANVLTYDGTLVHIAATAVVDAAGAAALRSIFPQPAGRGTAASRVVLSCGVVVIPDVLADPDYVNRGAAETAGFRSILAVPLMRQGEPIGVIAVGRAEPGPFPASHVALLQTFADQAVIAIENVRLFNEREARNRELSEALERQTATSQVLSAISRSPTELQLVLDMIVETARRLCRADWSCIMKLDDARFSLAAIHGAPPEVVDWFRSHPPALELGTLSGRAALERRTVYVEDATTDPRYTWRLASRHGNYRSTLGVPLLRQGVPIGVLSMAHHDVRAYTPEQVALVTTFADQAVIAIENVRLFTELEARTTELTQSVAQLRALGEVGRTVSSTLDLEAVLQTIVSHATRLSGMDGGAIYEYDAASESFRLRTTDRLPRLLVDALETAPLAKGEGAIGRLAATSAPVAIADILVPGVYQSRVHELLMSLGYRSLLAVPLLYEGHLLGGLVVNRKADGDFEPRIVELLQTFAAQSAIAIQNARLFREIEDKSRQLAIASQHKSAFVANMSHELRTPLNAIIGFTRIVMRRSHDSLDARQFENLEKILASGQGLLAQINAILDLAKVEAGRVEMKAGSVPLAPLLRQCLHTVEPLVEQGVTLAPDFGDDLPTMTVDEDMLRQILINLLGID